MTETSDFNPARLVLARQRRGWTKKSLADATSLSGKTISLYESGDLIPSHESLSSIAQALSFPLSFSAVSMSTRLLMRMPVSVRSLV